MPQPVQSPLLNDLLLKRDQAREEFSKKHSFAQKWLAEKGLTLGQIRTHAAKLLTGASLSSVLLLSTPGLTAVGKLPAHSVGTIPQFLNKLHGWSSKSHTAEEETEIMTAVSQLYAVSVAFELDRNRLPVYVGHMGLEQHLVRYPGDTVTQHGLFFETGMAPERGAFGYFARGGKTREQMEAEERFYIVLQTFLIESWDRDWVRLKVWYKFRKFLVINQETGKAVVTVLGDAGPATWTNKHFGGSPEVMASLGFYPKITKGEVLVLFLDDPGNTIPLGPVAIKK